MSSDPLEMSPWRAFRRFYSSKLSAPPRERRQASRAASLTPCLAMAIRRMNETPSDPWTLAKEAALFRSVLFEQFRCAVGVAQTEDDAWITQHAEILPRMPGRRGAGKIKGGK
jgi:hypothetical protein